MVAFVDAIVRSLVRRAAVSRRATVETEGQIYADGAPSRLRPGMAARIRIRRAFARAARIRIRRAFASAARAARIHIRCACQISHIAARS